MTKSCAWEILPRSSSRFRCSDNYVGGFGRYRKSLRSADQRREATLSAKLVCLDTHYATMAAPSCDSPSKGQVDCSDNNADGFVLVNARRNSNKVYH